MKYLKTYVLKTFTHVMLLASTLFIFLSVIAFAKTSEIKTEYNSMVSPAEYRDNLHEEYLAKDKILNTIYKKAINNLDKQEKVNLKKAQIAWIKFRDTDCYSRSYPMRGGVDEYTMKVNCLIDLTVDRIKTLKTYYE